MPGWSRAPVSYTHLDVYKRQDGYMQECLDALHSFIPSLGLEIGPLPDDRYAEIVHHEMCIRDRRKAA